MAKETVRDQSIELTKKMHDPKKFLEELHTVLKSNADEKAFANYRRIIPEMGKTFGTPLPVLRIIAAEIGKYGNKNPQQVLSILTTLWKSGSFEERQIVGKVMEKLGKKYPKECLELIPNFLPCIDNWANCDNLACFGMEPIIISKTQEVLSLCEKWVKDENKWIRRFAVVTLRAFKKIPATPKVFEILDTVMEDDESDVKKAVSWILREITKKDPQAVLKFLMKWTRIAGKNAKWIIKDGMKKLPRSNQMKILSLLER